ncbi:MAG: hypothetical protein R3F56_24565 [Planctomycetota bacterium]
MRLALRLSFLPTLCLTAGVAAQGAVVGTRSNAHVTADGVFMQTTSGPAVPQPSGVSPSPTGLRWTYSQATTRSIVNSATVGNHGTLGWLGCNLNNQRTSLFQMTEDNSPPVPVYEVLQPGTQSITVKAADKAPVCVVATVTTAPSGMVEYYRGSSAAPAWFVGYGGYIEAVVSDDGRYVAVGFTSATNTSQVDVYDAQSSSPTTPIRTFTNTSHGFRHIDISGDGSTVLLATNTMDHVYDVASNSLVFSATTVSHDAHTINGDGTVFGRAGFNPMRAWVKTGGTYQEVLTYNDTSLGFAVYTAADVSRDGSTFVAAGYDAQSNERMRVQCFQLTPTGSTLLWTYASDAFGQFQDTPQAVSISDDGKYIAVGSWGTAANDHPETLIFDRDVGATPIASVDSPGSCFDADISGDGQFVTVGTKSVHANTFGNGGEGYGFDLGGQAHWLVGSPSVGRSIELRTGGAVGELVYVGFASGLGGPLTVPGISGTFDLDLGSFSGFLFVGSVPAGGVHSLPLNIPNLSFFVGQSLFTQAFTSTPFAFSNTLRLYLTP